MMWSLTIAAFCTSIVAAVAGAGGGVLLIAVMSLLVPVGAVVPLHGAVQAASNTSRFFMLWRNVDWRFVGTAAAGCTIGVLLVGSFALTMPEQTTRLILGFGLLYLAWMPRLKTKFDFPGKVPLMALLVSIISMLIGPGGVLMASLRKREGLPKEQVMADQSGMMMVQHLLKFASFAYFGFNYKAWAATLIPAMVSSVLGTLVGVLFLRRMNEAWFDHLFKLLVTIIAGKLLVDAYLGA